MQNQHVLSYKVFVSCKNMPKYIKKMYKKKDPGYLIKKEKNSQT